MASHSTIWYNCHLHSDKCLLECGVVGKCSQWDVAASESERLKGSEEFISKSETIKLELGRKTIPALALLLRSSKRCWERSSASLFVIAFHWTGERWANSRHLSRAPTDVGFTKTPSLRQCCYDCLRRKRNLFPSFNHIAVGGQKLNQISDVRFAFSVPSCDKRWDLIADFCVYLP
jgi:hypothetical protein